MYWIFHISDSLRESSWIRDEKQYPTQAKKCSSLGGLHRSVLMNEMNELHEMNDSNETNEMKEMKWVRLSKS